MTTITTKWDLLAGWREQEGVHQTETPSLASRNLSSCQERQFVYLQGATIPIDFKNKVTVTKAFLLSVLLPACQLCCLKNRAERTSLECHPKGAALQQPVCSWKKEDTVSIKKANLCFRQASSISPWSRDKKQQPSLTASQYIWKLVGLNNFSRKITLQQAVNTQQTQSSDL